MNIEKGRKLFYEKEIFKGLNNLNSNEPYTMLCFRKIDKFLFDNLINNTITVASPSAFNDPYDCLIFKWLPLQYEAEKRNGAVTEDLEAWSESYRKIKVGCYATEDGKTNTSPLNNHLMWSHYADKHFGVCLKYVFKNSDFAVADNMVITRIGKVRYKDSVSLNELNSLPYSDAFLVKHKSWMYEQECRLIHYDPNCSDIYKNILIPQTALKEIYFGLRCRQQDIETIKNLFSNKGKNDVKFYKMTEDESNVYQLSQENYV